MTNCLVCDTAFEEANAFQATTYQGKTYYFCSEGCHRDFDQNPRRYLGSLQELDFSEQPFNQQSVPPKEKERVDGGLVR
jgi:YHS domain-containing protein